MREKDERTDSSSRCRTRPLNSVPRDSTTAAVSEGTADLSILGHDQQTEMVRGLPCFSCACLRSRGLRRVDTQIQPQLVQL
eukprot:2010487-Rhodomonas_salina.1